MGFYATTEVKEKNRYYPVFRSDKSENRLIKTESLPAVPDEFKVRVENVYDYAGRRVKKTVKDDYSGGSYTTTNVTTFIYNGWELIAEMSDAGHTNYYCYGIDASGTLGGAAGCGGLLAKTTVTASDTNTYFYLHDGNANVVGMVDEAGSVVASYEYSPFGICIKATGSQASSNAFRFSGHYFDIETGIYNGKRRYYSPTLGRYLSRDPRGERGVLHLYNYCFNNPLTFIDPDGRAPQYIYEGVTLTYDPATGAMDIQESPDWDWGDFDPYYGRPWRPSPAPQPLPPPSNWNPSGHAVIVQQAEVGFFFLAGVKWGAILLRFDNDYCQGYSYIGSGVGLGLGKTPSSGGAGGFARAGDVYNVYAPEDFEGGFLDVSGSIIRSRSYSTGFGGRPAVSETRGWAIPGIAGTYEGFWRVGPAYLCCEDGSPAPNDNLDCCE